MKKLLAILLLLSTIAWGQTADSLYQLPVYSYHKFENGFEVILVENHTNPLVASIVAVRTGSRNETPQISGASHMLEHMTFNGTDRRTQKALYDELDFHGIYLNAQTSEDYTTFMALNHKAKMDTTLDIMADMLFHSNFPAEKFEKEKGIIAEEIRKDSENPDFKKQQEVNRALFGDSPYGMPVIGTVETVSSMQRAQISEYYHTWYKPNNMFAMIIGDFVPEEMLRQLQASFGEAEPGEIPAASFPLTSSLPFFHAVQNEKNQTVYISLPAPTFFSDEYIPFQFYQDYALDAQNGKVVELLKASDSLKVERVQSSYQFHPEFAVLNLEITTAKETDPQQVKEAALAAFQNLEAQVPGESEFKSMKREVAIAEMLQMEKILYYGFLKAQELTIGGLQAFEKKIPAMLTLNRQEFSDFITSYPDTWNDPAKLFSEGNWTVKTDIQDFRLGKTSKGSSASRIYRKVLPNGLTVLQLHNSDNPVLAMHLLFKNRSAWEPEGKTGIADFLHHSLFKASENNSADSLQRQLQNIGAEIKTYDWDFIPYDNYYNTQQYSYVRFVTLDKFFNKALQLTAENILHPDFSAVFDEVKMEMSRLAARQQASAGTQAQLAYEGLLFGEQHPLAKPVSGTPETIEAITLAALQEFHKKYFSAPNTILSIVSSRDSATVFSAVEKYFKQMPGYEDIATIPPIPLTEGVQRDSAKIGSRQSYIYWGYAFDAGKQEAPALEVMNSMLSGQIAFSLREQKGWAYRLGSSVSSWKDRFYLTASMGTGRQTTHPAIQGIMEEINKFKSTLITQTAVEKQQNSMQAALVHRRASRENQAYTLGLNEFLGYQPGYFFEIYDEIDGITPAAVRQVRDKYLQTENYRLLYTIPEETGQTEMPQGMPAGMGRK
ncbi:MAG: pitrilysin family protein [Calditrichia bacterium]